MPIGSQFCDPMTHSPNWGTTLLKDETAEPGDAITPEKSRKTGSSFAQQDMPLVPICGVAWSRFDPSIYRMS
jgi:hypothetical protein